MKRSDEQKQAFALKCLEIEQSGGDVLGYIEQEYPSYTPRATWYHLQKAWLGRKAYDLTEGKPKEKGVKYMGKMMELAKGCLEAYGRGETVFDYLKSQGSKNPSAYWYQLKQTAKLKDPDLYEQLSVIRTGERKKPQEEKPVLQTKEAETIFFGGKEYEKLEGEGAPVNEYREKPSPTCCQPARPSGVTVPEELPEEKTESLPVCAVKSRVKGEWHLSPIKGCVHLIWEDKITHEERSLGLPAEDWKKLSDEIPIMLKQLGL